MVDNKKLVIVVISIMVFCMIWGSNRFSFKTDSAVNQKSIIDKMIRQSARYATAAQQDESPVVAVLHANYSAAYFFALTDIASYDEIHAATGIDVKKFKESLIRVQDETTRKIIDACPEFRGQTDIFLARIGGEA